jgi:hypothetical protein
LPGGKGDLALVMLPHPTQAGGYGRGRVR